MCIRSGAARAMGGRRRGDPGPAPTPAPTPSPDPATIETEPAPTRRAPRGKWRGYDDSMPRRQH